MCDILTYKETMGGEKVLKHYLKVCFKMMGTHVITAIFSFMLCPLIFLALLSSRFGWILMSVATSIGYAIMVYSCAYKVADKDIKVYSTNKPYILKGIVLAIPTLLVTLVLTCVYDFTFAHQFADYDLQMKTQLVGRSLFLGWNFMFEGFRVGVGGAVSTFYWVLSYALMPIASFLGYWAGMNRYDFGYKFFSAFVYKKPENK